MPKKLLTHLNRYMNFRRGFTLIELLVVIAIIGLLSSIVFAAVSSARTKARLASGQSLAQQLFRGYGDNAAGVWNLDEGSGTNAANSSSNSSTPGVIVSGVWVSDAGPNGKPALQFGSGRRVNVGTIVLPQAVTIAAWVQTTSNGQQPAFSNRGTGIYFGTTGGRFFTYYNNSSVASMISTATVNDGRWHHVVWTSNGSIESMYIDGKPDSQMAQTRTGNDSGVAYIGYDSPNNEYFSGKIAQVAVYTQTLALSDIEKLYAFEAIRFAGDGVQTLAVID